MADCITRETVLEVARLAKLQLPESEIPAYQQHLSQMLDYLSQIAQHPCDQAVQPFFGICESSNAVRPDQIVASYPRDLMLANAVETDDQFYLVPKVLE